MNTQTKFDIALAKAEERARHTDWDQHILAEGDDYVVHDGGDGELPQWRIDQIIYTVTGKLCLEDERQINWLPIIREQQLMLVYDNELPY